MFYTLLVHFVRCSTRGIYEENANVQSRRRPRMSWTVGFLVLYLGMLRFPSPADSASYSPIERTMRSSTSLTCNVQKFRSRIEAAVVCHGDANCRATWTPLQSDETSGFALCSCMARASYGGMDDTAWRLRLQIPGAFNTGGTCVSKKTLRACTYINV